MPAQHLSVALHEVVASLQIEPAGEQTLPLSHLPTACPVDFEHFTFVVVPSGSVDDPQQSVSPLQISPTGRQPDSGRQTLTPVA